MSIENSTKNSRPFEFAEIYFNAYETYCMIKIERECDGKEILSACREIAFQVQDTLNIYDPRSELSRLCACYRPLIPYHVSNMLYDFLKVNKTASKYCYGIFDPTIGNGIRYWEECQKQESVPESEIMKKILYNSGMEHIHLNPETTEVMIDVPGITIHPGASGKGFALDRVIHYLRNKQVQNACLNFGGNIYVLGSPSPAAEGWKIGIRDPDESDKIVTEVVLKDQAISTSSWYEHYFEKDGIIYSHLINPQSGICSVSDFSSVSVITDIAVYGDILSTALFLLGQKKGMDVIEQLRQTGISISCVGVR
ncbi:hypothetical protein B5F07_02900 [Lachnoclostridium sp. An169]|uniref:FAD:protein FMN transferase n=1 Tax=Lachnoclostridium sp. An169 TaxID=1965569 RepID=UPI000B3A3020|nr:FAD:protein FMN transferase [Lachnoclostridium sp. An169]OUP85642.1 hypothetical protein B5F07_02900 [Lachnoclostridium sp. An169]HJA66356.1 FAD:protein FMN transferase [Candidatus Mediterraneibacter cottocaccae]